MIKNKVSDEFRDTIKLFGVYLLPLTTYEKISPSFYFSSSKLLIGVKLKGTM